MLAVRPGCCGSTQIYGELCVGTDDKVVVRVSDVVKVRPGTWRCKTRSCLTLVVAQCFKTCWTISRRLGRYPLDMGVNSTEIWLGF